MPRWHFATNVPPHAGDGGAIQIGAWLWECQDIVEQERQAVFRQEARDRKQRKSRKRKRRDFIGYADMSWLRGL